MFTRPASACSAQKDALLSPSLPYDGCLVQPPGCLHFLFTTSTMPSSACAAQNSPLVLYGGAKIGRVLQPSWAHFVLRTFTIPGRACVKQNSAHLSLVSMPNDARFVQYSSWHLRPREQQPWERNKEKTRSQLREGK